jgi:hypothetical protein
MSSVWVDANVLLRLITNEPLALAERAEQGEVALKISQIVVGDRSIDVK